MIHHIPLQNNIGLRKINLSWNGFSTDGAQALGDALKSNTNLEELDVTWVNLLYISIPDKKIKQFKTMHEMR